MIFTRMAFLGHTCLLSEHLRCIWHTISRHGTSTSNLPMPTVVP